jgi:hypothetical protein
MLARLFIFAILALQAHAEQGALIKPEDTELALTGKISFVHGYGPPGWGEDPKHDARIVYWIIDLPAQINTPCTPERPEWAALDCQATKSLRLIVEGNKRLVAEAKSVQGRIATVKGTLHRQDTAGEITPIFMQVIAIEAAP